MLSGVQSVSEGDAFVYGKSIVEDMQSVRQSIGVCQQRDILYADLTVREHMLLFAGVKVCWNSHLQTAAEPAGLR